MSPQSRHGLFIGVMLLGVVSVSLAGQCPDSWNEEVHGERTMICCHIPQSSHTSKVPVKDALAYCQQLGALYGVDKETQLCFLPGTKRVRRQLGFLNGGVPPPYPPPGY